MSACARCEDQGMILDAVGPGGAEFYRPCPDCRPEAHELFMGGHLDSGHDCAACAARRGKRRSGPSQSSRGGEAKRLDPVKAAPARDPDEPLPLPPSDLED